MNPLPEAFAEIGVQLPLLITGWSALALLVLAVACAALTLQSNYWEDSLWTFAAVFLGGCGALVAAFWLCLLIPFDGKYHHYYAVEGTVESVSNVLSEANGDLTRQPVITLDNVDRPLVIDDPRAVSLQDARVALRCTVNWNYQAADSYSCRIVNFDTQAGAR